MNSDYVFDKDKTNMVKGIAILLLLFHHLFLVNDRLIANGVVMSGSLYSFLYQYIVQARICVWIFVFLSAYGLTKSYSREENIIKFFIHHWLSLMKQWWIVMGFMAIIYQLFVGNLIDYYQHSFRLFILDLFEWNDFFGYPRILGSWYLCFAQILIVVFPILYSFVSRYNYLSIPIFFILMQFMGDGINSTGGGPYIQYIPASIVGILIANNSVFEYLMQKREKSFLGHFSRALCLLVALFFLNMLRYRIMDNHHVGSFLAAIISFGVSIFVAVYLSNSKIGKMLGMIGKYSAVIFMTNVFAYIELPNVIYFTHNALGTYFTLVIFCMIFAVFVSKVSTIIKYDSLCDRIEKTLIRKVEE